MVIERGYIPNRNEADISNTHIHRNPLLTCRGNSEKEGMVIFNLQVSSISNNTPLIT